MYSKKWLKSLFFTVTLVLITLILTTYLVDPYLYYRIGDNKYVVGKPELICKGLIKNANYDAVIIGSSMAQNFTVKSFKEKLGYDCIKLVISAMNLDEIAMMSNLVSSNGKAKRLFITLDTWLFFSMDKNRFPSYLYDDNIYNDYKYLLGFDTYRVLPYSLFTNICYKLGIFESVWNTKKTNPDYLGEWKDDYKIGKKITWDNYFNGNKMFSSYKDNADLYEVMVDNFKCFINELNINDSLEYTLILPPYSALLWYCYEKDGDYADLIKFKTYLVDSFSKYKNIQIVDMQNMLEIIDLKHYKDVCHYGAYIQELIVDAIASGKYDVTHKNIQAKNDSLHKLKESFKKENKEILERGYY